MHKLAAFISVLVSLTMPATLGQAPDTILFNGRILTLDDDSFAATTGTISQALAITNGRISRVGSNDEVRSLAGPGTRLMNLGGRTVTPGLIGVHEHPYDWTLVNPYILRKLLPDELVVTRVLDGSPEEQLRRFPAVLREAVAKARKGQWIYLLFTLGENYQYSSRGNAGLGGIPGQYPLALFGAGTGRPPLISKDQVDSMAPDNPVLLRDNFTQLVLNTRGLAAISEVFPKDITDQINPINGIGGADPIRWVFSDVVMREHYQVLLEMSRVGLNWWAGYGMTSFASAAYTPTNIRVFNDLSRSQRMDMRNMWTWNWRNRLFINDEYLLNALMFLEGLGNDYFWHGGAFLATGLGCSSLTPLVPVSESSRRCGLAPGSSEHQVLQRFLKRGGRYTTAHFTLDGDVDHLLDLIEKVAREEGLSAEQMQARRLSFDHIPMLRPDQLNRVRALGMVVGSNAFEIYQSAPGILKVYGEKAVDWVVPKKSLMEAGIRNGFEIDRAIESTNLTAFWSLARFITREAWDGKVYGPGQRIGRELALKTATTWGAYYLAREADLGSLETNKWADLLVLDRDYLTVPEQEIQQIRVLMTMVGGRIVHLVPSLAGELGTEPRGAQVEYQAAAAGW